MDNEAELLKTIQRLENDLDLVKRKAKEWAEKAARNAEYARIMEEHANRCSMSLDLYLRALAVKKAGEKAGEEFPLCEDAGEECQDCHTQGDECHKKCAPRDLMRVLSYFNRCFREAEGFGTDVKGV